MDMVHLVLIQLQEILEVMAVVVDLVHQVKQVVMETHLLLVHHKEIMEDLVILKLTQELEEVVVQQLQEQLE